ncbi:3-hydroxyacyl-CoA dehydrogenase/enoyl-CoA hydratase family protein [Candidatus Acetothermia bacterium]|jgi:3-hydroxyacyl-CoA dehydrogenase|nr:3-hydroxyacyl-CoA dehydrogenase/enoyl-CoA hydratase family protein [Candidatus Acetothermia bacterium]MCI2432591.1 3-hydroxyacyl-CoA dehydrogenase/enoyl-CoA hydratase family protein [Candidatus Acetothermia bacterium]MCI2436869.1 3-hydroxyacyl-CoA dehydrogenase/enoyl-CoA hydratase family protein [Candidatus Acetothermia bacterium]
MREIKTAAVLGAGTMGAGIAALLSGAGIKTHLLDIIPKELTPEEKSKGLTLSDPTVRNRIVNAGLQRALKASPALFYDTADAQLITVGNIEDNLDRLREVDWIVEAVFERLDVKQDIFAKIERFRSPDSIVSSNTSGIALKAIMQKSSPELKKHTLITHFFNPVRYMKLLEVIPGGETDPQILKFITDFAERKLGKGVVLAKDTPNFICNRIGIFGISYLLKAMQEGAYKVEEIDAIFGPALGRPKSAVFRTVDLVGLDVMADVIKNIYASLPSDPMREIYRLPNFIEKMLSSGLLGRKTGKGFYQEKTVNGKREFLVFDYKALDYRRQEKFEYPSLVHAGQQSSVGEKIKTVVYSDDRAGQIAWQTLSETLLYTAHLIPEISDNIYSVDNAMKWGFNWEQGPFETWDAIGVRQSVERMRREGKKIPALVEELLKRGESFYARRDSKKLYFDVQVKDYRELPQPKGVLVLSDLKEDEKRVITESAGASLTDLGDGVACLEFHTYMNTVDADVIAMLGTALEEVRKRGFAGLVIGNEGQNFCVGANVGLVLGAIQSQAWEQLDQMVKAFQDVDMAIKYFEKPVVAAPFNMTLGGGAEIVLHCPRVRAHCELYIGQVEFGVGVIPAAGGCKELWARQLENLPEDANVDLFPFLQRVFELIGLAKVATSAKEAKKFGFLRRDDKITMNKDRLIADAKGDLLALVRMEYEPPRPKKYKVTGRSGYAALQIAIKNFQWGKRITDHEALMAQKLARVLTGGDVEIGTEITEQQMLDLEREAFLSLCGTQKTQERIQHMLATGRPLRN